MKLRLPILLSVVIAFLITSAQTTAQHFVLNYTHTMHASPQLGQQLKHAPGTIELTKTAIKYDNGHAEDIYYIGSTQGHVAGLGECTFHTWSRVDNIGSTYIRAVVFAGEVVRVSIDVPRDISFTNTTLTNTATKYVYINTTVTARL